MTDAEQPDLVDVFYVPFVRALGNLVITFANAEAALLELTTEMKCGNEVAALELLKASDHKDKLRGLVQGVGLQGFELTELVESIERFWCDKDRRNRYIHDEWYVGFHSNRVPRVVPGTRGTPRKKASTVVWDEPTPDDVWQLALRFREYRGLFSYTAYKLAKRRAP